MNGTRDGGREWPSRLFASFAIFLCVLCVKPFQWLRSKVSVTGIEMKLIATVIMILSVCSAIGQQTDDRFVVESVEHFFVLNGDTVSGRFTDSTITDGKFSQWRRVRYKRWDADTIISPRETGGYVYTVQFHALGSGEFKDGQRAGIWEFFSDWGGTSYSWERGLHEDYTIQYKTDTVIWQEAIWGWRKRIYFVNDSTSVFGHVFLKDDMMVEFRCAVQEGCSFWLSEEKLSIVETKFEEFFQMLARIEFGDFDRQIRLVRGTKSNGY